MKFTLAVCVAAICLAIAGCTDHSSSSAGSTGGKGSSGDDLKKVKITDIKVGTGPAAELGDSLVVEYVGKLMSNGAEFDENMRAPGQDGTKAPFTFTLSNDHPQVIAGWNEGMIGMKVGGERQLDIPWSKAYGETGSGEKIPPRANLTFDVKLIGMIKKGKENDYGVTEIKKGSGPVVKAKDWVTLTYSAEYLNGFGVASSEDAPVQFQAGTKLAAHGDMMLVKGLSYGVIGMQAGGERKLTLPYSLVVNPMQRTPLPPQSVVVFDVKLIRVSSKEEPDAKGSAPAPLLTPQPTAPAKSVQAKE